MAFGDLWLFLFPGFALFLAWLTSPSVSGLSLASSFRQNIQKKFSLHFSSAFVPFSQSTSFRFKLVPTPKYRVQLKFRYGRNKSRNFIANSQVLGSLLLELLKLGYLLWLGSVSVILSQSNCQIHHGNISTLELCIFIFEHNLASQKRVFLIERCPQGQKVGHFWNPDKISQKMK